ncbi:CPBP family intramembrane glutamic endopeptidase [Oceanobacillus jordanicus]|uniref:CPBP family intramembrane metalloprotease n=1 Tax=Oceanobacillus jordanicus TaxID=2867266 RepID=A0AAW5B9B2_9BACI|nr:type II CAAX endopeptidase family protein [Oceanobacillus jordanicus]MCG3419966.1 CPBP family intramembrane metalloprotease [Oceanobacillus jordanicus]
MKKSNREVPSGVPYHRVMVSNKPQFLRGVIAFILLIGGMFIFILGFSLIGGEIDSRVFGRTSPVNGGTDYTPIYMASNFLAVGLLIPWSMVLQRWLYGMKGNILHSVLSSFRAELFGRAILVTLPIMTVCIVTLNYFAPYTVTEWTTNDLLLILALSILLVPLQIAGEEYGFRGLVFQISSSWFKNPKISLVVGITVSSLLFASIHLSADIWFNLHYIMLGISFAIMTWRTGGLEYAVVIHALNNSLTYILATVLRTDLLADVDRTDGMEGTWIIFIPSAASILISICIWYKTRHTGPVLTSNKNLK